LDYLEEKGKELVPVPNSKKRKNKTAGEGTARVEDARPEKHLATSIVIQGREPRGKGNGRTQSGSPVPRDEE